MAYRCCKHCEEDGGPVHPTPADEHLTRCPDGCNDGDAE